MITLCHLLPEAGAFAGFLLGSASAVLMQLPQASSCCPAAEMFIKVYQNTCGWHLLAGRNNYRATAGDKDFLILPPPSRSTLSCAQLLQALLFLSSSMECSLSAAAE